MAVSTFNAEIEQKFNQIISLVSEAFFIAQADFSKIVYVSDTWEKVFGHPKEEIIQNPGSWMNYVLPEYHPMLQREIQKMLQTGETPNNPIHYRVRWPDGSIHWIRGSVLPLKDETGKVTQIAGVIGDVTREKEIEMRLDDYTTLLEEETMKRTKNLEEAQKIAKLGSWEWDIPANQVTWSNELYEIFGVTSRDAPLTYEAYLKFIHPDDRERIKRIIDDAYAAKQPYRFDCRLVRADGRVIFHHGEGKIITDEAGQVVKMMGIGQDTTDRVKAEMKTEEARQRFEAVAKRITDLVYELNMETNTLDWYGDVDTVLGFAPGEFPRALEGWEKAIHPEDRERVLKLFDDALKENAGFDVEYRVLKKNGDIAFWYDRGGVVKSRSGAPDKFIGAISDVTENKKKEARIRELNDIRNRFIRIVSHQMRTPLSVIRFNIENFLESQFGPVSEAQADILRTIQAANLDIINRIGDLTTAMDIEEGRVVLSKDGISLETVLAGVVAENKKRFKNKKIDFVFDGPEKPLPLVVCDSEKIREAINKIIENAFLYSESGEIRTALKRKDNSVRLEVRDHGIGIPKLEQDRIFNRFFRASNASTLHNDASGVGLSIAKYFIEQHKGTIGFTSEEGKGSIFWFEIPIE